MIGQLGNVATAMHCNLRPPDAVPVLITCNFVARAKFEVAKPIRCRLRALTADTLRYALTLNYDPVTLTFNLRL